MNILRRKASHILKLYVEDKYRNSGVGKRLVMHALELIKKAQVRTVYCAVGKHMKDTQEFYKHIEFEPSHELWFEKNL